MLEADGAAKRGLLWSTVTGVVAEEEDEETRADGGCDHGCCAGRQICQMGCFGGGFMGEERGSRRRRGADHRRLERRLTGRESCRRGAHGKGGKRVG